MKTYDFICLGGGSAGFHAARVATARVSAARRSTPPTPPAGPDTGPSSES